MFKPLLLFTRQLVHHHCLTSSFTSLFTVRSSQSTMDPQLDGSQQFCLRWHNYQTSLLATLPQLLDGEDLTDVTLSAGGRHMKAHKVVLSACSHYFKQLFKVSRSSAEIIS